MTEKINKRHIDFNIVLNMIAITLSFGFVVIMVFYRLNLPTDYEVYVESTKGNFAGYYYPYWTLALVAPFVQLPFFVGYILWGWLNIAGLIFATRVFGGKIWLALLNFQLFYLVYIGNIEGIVAAGFAIYWLLVKDRPLASGLGAVMALAKPQFAAPVLVTIGLIRSDSWRNRLLSTVPVILAIVLSFVIAPDWLAELIDRLQTAPPDTRASISLWNWFGPLALVLWVGVFLPMKSKERLIMVTATAALSLPYFQQTGLLILYMFPVGYLSLLGNLGFFALMVEDLNALKILVIIPLVAYVHILYNVYSRYRMKADPSELPASKNENRSNL